jgi:hypothetical protein
MKRMPFILATLTLLFTTLGFAQAAFNGKWRTFSDPATIKCDFRNRNGRSRVLRTSERFHILEVL